MLVVNSKGRIVRITRRPNEVNALNRYCHIDQKNARMSRSSVYMFEYPNTTPTES